MKIEYFDIIDSTQKYALELINNTEIYNNFTIIANKQTNGVGRNGAKWIDGLGNIMMSCVFIINQNVHEKIKDNFSVIVGEMILQSILSICHDKLKFSIKHPNDLMINGNKFGGIMINFDKKNNIHYCIIGIGINLISSPVDIANPAYEIINLVQEKIIIKKEELINIIISDLSNLLLSY